MSFLRGNTTTSLTWRTRRGRDTDRSRFSCRKTVLTVAESVGARASPAAGSTDSSPASVGAADAVEGRTLLGKSAPAATNVSPDGAQNVSRPVRPLTCQRVGSWFVKPGNIKE